ncbi:MAG: preprotein translocase subunit YajC [Tannerella sp.]|jgi:preprotein translocase subunit YajC|nr:preprotein translocase subunit YajC [Tannerella sp.]
MNTVLNVLLQDSATGSNGSMGIIMIVAMVAIFYFFMIRPQQKRQKDLQKARAAMQTGDKVVTAGGIHGRIKEMGDKSMLIEVADGVRIRVDKASVFASSEDIPQK